MNDEDLKKLTDGTVAALTAELPGLADGDLEQLLHAEKGRGDGDGRVTAIKAIEAEQAKRTHEEEGSAGETAPGANALAAVLDDPSPENLAGLDLATLDALRTLEVAGQNRPQVVEDIEDAAGVLREEFKNAPEIDPGKTVLRAVPEGAAHDAVKAGPVKVLFLEGGDALKGIPATEFQPSMFSFQGGSVLLERAIKIFGDVPPATITHAALVDEGEALVGLCEIPHGLRVGQGREAEFPAGSLRF